MIASQAGATIRFPGFTSRTDQIFVRDGIPESSESTSVSNGSPVKTLIIFAWGDAQPKNITKYADGFRTLHPSAKQIVVLSPIYKALWRSMAQRVEAMSPIVDEVFPPTGKSEAEQDHDGSGVLIQVMSNTGGIAYAAALHAYRNRYGRPFPHRLVVLDSTPGSTDLTFANMRRFALAMALGTAKFFPWPFCVTRGLWAVFLYVLNLIEKILGRTSAGAESVKVVGNPELASLETKRLYLYGKEDQIILWSDIEAHIAESRRKGWEVQYRVFEGSGHVEHMRKHPVAYWKAIKEAWEDATGTA
ncbi:hypothetical protein AN2370.2 [Aspergillus nidulans FGSC A4]|uniref:Indole-diterpene biosynthesis protein PaxU n=1 Tax=Emericella nidulans (strain FGSC A4 / ATCC 38163 / CBS 112.46 / NRRL 194 / M139) TaxID=227321 RepID=Q5BAR0_EMENI|nr:hypothetical protein [Aspergillus nidulans FGSC A4]EAA64481.1 hypothetical protein AN2370.2 [Aspergillus nidulans FGSC A4]CBF86707.1 TPA: conserved hypothetical protein [Aspergillus nidulans FGSC A4]|eukprot:XP_659974.1 hypothetical protein AN2370.2 [Aspergillus nidulans FGSC A4]